MCGHGCCDTGAEFKQQMSFLLNQSLFRNLSHDFKTNTAGQSQADRSDRTTGVISGDTDGLHLHTHTHTQGQAAEWAKQEKARRPRYTTYTINIMFEDLYVTRVKDCL